MRVIERIRSFINPKKNKDRVLIKSKFGLPTLRVCGVVLTDLGTQGSATSGSTSQQQQQQAANATAPASGFAEGANTQEGPAALSAMRAPIRSDEVTDMYLRDNEDAKDLINNLVGVVSIRSGVANEQYEVICVTYNHFLDLNMLMKIYSFTSGEQTLFANSSKQKKNCQNIFNSMKISSIDIVDLVSFE